MSTHLISKLFFIDTLLCFLHKLNLHKKKSDLRNHRLDVGGYQRIGLIQVKKEVWTGFSKGWQGWSEGFPKGEARGKSRGRVSKDWADHQTH